MCLFLPGLPEGVRAAFASRLPGEAPILWGLTTDFNDTPTWGYANCWWMLSRSALDSMLDIAGFTSLESSSDSPYWVDLIAAPTGRASVLPPTSFARERGKSRIAAG